MKNLILLLAFILISTVHAGTCTSISRTNSASLSVLTSSKYNSDLNTAYTFLNSYDAGCVASGSLESDALNTTQFAPLLKGLQQGCKVLYSNASTLQIDKCLASVNGNFVTTTTTTNVSFGCTGCSAEVASTTYYVYIQTGSTGSTLTPLILTTAPNNDGYDNSGNKVLGRFYNNASSDISQYSIDQWHTNGFISTNTPWTSYTPVFQGYGTPTLVDVKWKRVGSDMLIRGEFTTGTTTATEARIGLPNSEVISLLNASAAQLVGTGYRGDASAAEHTLLATNAQGYLRASRADGSLTNLTPQNASALIGTGIRFSFQATVPIDGWSN